MAELTDHELLAKMAAGDTLALRQLYSRLSDRVYNTAISHVQVASEAEEVTQDVFTKVWRNAASFKGGSKVSTWVYRITVNTALTALKRRQRRSVFGVLSKVHDPPDFQHPNALLEEAEQNKALFAAIYQLPDRQKTAFILSYVEELPRQQVAEVMNVSLKSVESLLMRAKKGLRSSLQTIHPHRGKTKKK
ncbi:MAG: RNA polymerase sigma factor [Bacteroidota bacterium]